jgi:glycosyltransferase involved in cell wall biosynthesis
VDAEPARRLRIALLTYRGKATSGGQGVYVRHLSRALVRLGHHVEVFSGPPYPQLDEGVPLVRVPSLDLYREPDPFRTPALDEFRDWIDVVEYAGMCTAAFPEPLTFSLRARRLLSARRGDFDVVHDNQCLGYGLLGIPHLPVVATYHHPVVVDRDLALDGAGWLRRVSLRRWYAFARMQQRVAARMPFLLTVSQASRSDLATALDLPAERFRVVPVGVDPASFRPLPHIERVPGRLMTVASAETPLKGVVPLLEALAKVRTEHHAELVLVGSARPKGEVARTIARLGLADAVRFEHGVSEERLVELYASAQIAVVPSLYEGFSLPAVEAMACGVPLVATTGGAVPEVAGTDGETALLVEPGDPEQLADGIRRFLDDPALRDRIAAAGRQRALRRFTWEATAAGTAECYREVVGPAGAKPRSTAPRLVNTADRLARVARFAGGTVGAAAGQVGRAGSAVGRLGRIVAGRRGAPPC